MVENLKVGIRDVTMHMIRCCRCGHRRKHMRLGVLRNQIEYPPIPHYRECPDLFIDGAWGMSGGDDQFAQRRFIHTLLRVLTDRSPSQDGFIDFHYVNSFNTGIAVDPEKSGDRCVLDVMPLFYRTWATVSVRRRT